MENSTVWKTKYNTWVVVSFYSLKKWLEDQSEIYNLSFFSYQPPCYLLEDDFRFVRGMVVLVWIIMNKKEKQERKT